MSIVRRPPAPLPKLTEWEAQQCLRSLYFHHELTVPNVLFCDTEMDFCVVTRSGYLWEIEIKMTLADWLNDQKKRKWNCNGERLSPKVARFFYAVPEKLLANVPEFVPASTGLIKLHESNGHWFASPVRDAKQLCDYKVTQADKVKLLESMYHRYWRARMDHYRLSIDYRALHADLLQLRQAKTAAIAPPASPGGGG